jgi:signal recognition particle receptor subunit beta
MAFLLTGQTDSGKSTIAGHLLYKVGYFDTLPDDDKKLYRKHLENIDTSTSKSKYSILMDLIDGEILNNKTKTQEFAVCEFDKDATHFTLVDTPGHQLYIRSLLQGLFHLHKLNVLCLVVSSVKPEFWESWHKGTVRENLLLGRSVGCPHLIILWNKADLATPGKQETDTLLTFCSSLRFKTTTVHHVSGYTGAGLLDILQHVAQHASSVNTTVPRITRLERRIVVHGMFFMTPEMKEQNILISRGFQCVLHHVSGEYEVEIDNIVDDESKPVLLVRKNENVRLTLVLNRDLACSSRDRVILRHLHMTLGFGVLE